MRLRSFTTAALAAHLLTFPALADSALPRLQPPDPVFEKHDIKSRPTVCNGFAGYGSTIEQTVQLAVVEPLASIADDLMRLFRPFFTNTATAEERSHRSAMSKSLKLQSPSSMVRIAERKRLCG